MSAVSSTAYFTLVQFYEWALLLLWASRVAQCKGSACNVGDPGSNLGWEDPLEKGMATHSSILVWRIPWTEEPGRLYSPWGYKESNTTERLTHAHVILIMGFPGRAVVKNLPANAADKRDWGSNLWVRKVPWRRK